MDGTTLEAIAARARGLGGTESVRRFIAELATVPPLDRGALGTAGQFAVELKRLHADLLEGCLHWRERSLLPDITEERRLVLELKREQAEALAMELAEVLKRVLPEN
jgi:hypothetical protein